MNLRDYQVEAIDNARESFKQGNKKVILSLPTGSGKTVCAMYMVKNALDKGKRVAFITDRLSLLDQTARYMSKNGIDFGIIQGDHILTDYAKQFQICSAQTLARREHGDKFDFCIIDEIQVLYKHQLNLLKNSNGTHYLGLSATPWSRGLGRYWDDLVTGPSVSQLIKDGYLSDYVCYGPSKPDLTGVRTSAGDYNKKDIADRTDKKEITGDIIKHWVELALNRKTIVMAVNVAHAEHICEAFKDAGVLADVIHCYLEQGETQKRLEIFRNNQTQVLCSVDMLSRGFDQPDADCLVIARPTKSLIYHIQALGRVLRTAEGKKNALILDHAGNIERLGFPDDDFDMTLDMGIKSEKKKREKKEKLPKPCPKCFFMKTTQICPQCGFKSEKQPGVETKEGILEVMQKDRSKKDGQIGKEKLYSKLLAGAKSCGFSEGWAAHQYRNFYGVWPAKKTGIDIDERFYNFLSNLPKHRKLKIVWSIVPQINKS